MLRPPVPMRLLVEAMEERILHSADVAPLLAAPATVDSRLVPELAQPAAQASSPSEIVFIDASVPDIGSLIADLRAQQDAGRSIEIVVIGTDEDGLTKIGEVLGSRHDIGTVHLLTHGDDGVVQLGKVALDANTLLHRAGEIAGWGGALTHDADLLLYGCDLAETAAGQRFVRDLAALTGADVAASSDRTGASSMGGDWSLEYASGSITAALAPSAAQQASWQGVLPAMTYTVTNTIDVVGANLLPGTLRWAISQANANAGTDTIVFAVNGSFSISGLSSGDDSNASGDFDISDSVNIVGNGSAQTVIQGNGIDRVFDVRGGSLALSGLTIQGGASNVGAGLRIGSSAGATLTDVVVQNNVGAGASKGGGIYNNGTLALTNVIVRGNGNAVTGDVDGAGVFNDSGAVLSARNVEFVDNLAARDKDGGGLYIKDNSVATLAGVTFAGNQAKRGGGLFNQADGITLTNVTLSGNSASSQGGGLWAERTITLDHVSVAGNSAASGGGGGVYDRGGRVSTSNSLFAANSGGNSNMALVSLGYNLSDDASAGLSAPGDRNSTAVGLSALAYNGGFTRTMAIGAASPAADAADPATALLADQRGVAYYAGRADIGAYEYNPNGFAPTISAIADQTVAEDAVLGPLAFVIGDFESGASGLVVTATSSNLALVPDANLVIGGSGANRTLSLTPAADANGDASGGPTTITLSVSDGANVTTTRFTVTVQAVNDAPLLAVPAPQTVGEDTVLTLAGANAPTLVDVDAGSAPVQLTLGVAHGVLTLARTTGLSFVSGDGSDNASMSFIGSQSAINAALDGLSYRPAADFNGADALTLSVNDLGNTGSGGAKTASSSLAITVDAVNDAPVLGLPGPQVTPQNTGFVFSTANGNAVSVADVDAGGAPIQLTLSTGASTTGTLTLAATAGLTFSLGSGSGDVTMTFSGLLADINNALDGLSFSPDAAFTGNATLQIDADDLGASGSPGAQLASGTIELTVSADQAPTLTLAQTSLVFTENDVAAALDPGLTLGDADTSTLATATVRIGSGYAGAQDELRFVNDGATMGNILGAYSAGVLGLSSSGATATLAQWEAALRAVSYVNTSDAPSAAPRVVRLTINDGIADSAMRNIVVTVTPVNDAPVLAGANDLVPIDEDATNAGGTLVSALIAGQITDLDAGPVVGIAVTGLDSGSGAWQYTTDGTNWSGLASASESAALLLSADALSAIRFVPDADWNGLVAPALSLRAWDASSGSAGSVVDVAAEQLAQGGRSAFSASSGSAAITVRAVNDAPALALSLANQGATQDIPFSFGVPAGTFTDVDAGDTLTYGAALASGAALPAWLSFDPATATFSGTPRNADVGTITLRVTATDTGNASAFGDFTLTVGNVNDAPRLDQPIADQSASEDAAFRFVLPSDSFVDPDAGDTLSYRAALASGGALPGWLGFDPATATFSGTPGDADVGSLVVRVTATDRGNLEAFGDFVLDVANANDAPVLAQALANARATQDLAFNLALPPGSFSDPDAGDTLTYGAKLASGAALPGWLGFDPSTATFSGTPGNADVGSLVVRVTATDRGNLEAFGDFVLDVVDVDDAPVLAQPIADQASSQGAAFSFALPAGSFTDPDAGDRLSYRASLASAAPLPAWLSFDAATQTFAGTPGNADVGALTLRVHATDLGGASTFADFMLVVADANDAPVLAQPLADLATSASAPFVFVIPAATFSDADAGDTLRYAVTLADGAPLPAWLRFDAQSRALSGSPGAQDLGAIDLRVTATDAAGASAQARFVLTVAASTPAPVAAPPELAAPPAPEADRAEPEAARPVETPAAAAAVTRAAPPPAAPAANEGWLQADPADPGLQRGVDAARPSGEPAASAGSALASRADAVLADAVVAQFGGISMSSMTQLLRSDELMRKLEELQRQMLEQADERRTVIASSVAMSSGLSIGYVVWLVRGGVLVSSMLSALPAWQMIDPLPVLATSGARGKKGQPASATPDEPEVERLFDDPGDPRRAAPPVPAAGATLASGEPTPAETRP